MSVRTASSDQNLTSISQESGRGGQMKGPSFSAVLPPEVMVKAAYHNLDPEAERQTNIAVLFQPNSTSDLFEIVLKSMDGTSELRLIKLDMITGKSRMESDPAKFTML